MVYPRQHEKEVVEEMAKIRRPLLGNGPTNPVARRKLLAPGIHWDLRDDGPSGMDDHGQGVEPGVYSGIYLRRAVGAEDAGQQVFRVEPSEALRLLNEQMLDDALRRHEMRRWVEETNEAAAEADSKWGDALLWLFVLWLLAMVGASAGALAADQMYTYEALAPLPEWDGSF